MRNLLHAMQIIACNKLHM